MAGESAGGHLAALLGLVEGKSKVRAVCALYPVTDLVEIGREYAKANPSDIERLLGGPIESKLALARAASPVNHVSRAAPPFLFIHGDKDTLVPMDHSRKLNHLLHDAGAESTLIVAAGKGHWFMLDQGQKAVVARFYERHLAKRPSNQAGRPKSPRGSDAQHDESDENDQLGDGERRLGLSGRHGFESGHFFEELHDENEEIEVKRGQSGDHVGLPPGARELPPIESIDRNGERDQRQDAQHVRRAEPMRRRQEKAGGARQDRRDQKKRGPTPQSRRRQHPARGHESRKNSKQAQPYMNEKEGPHARENAWVILRRPSQIARLAKNLHPRGGGPRRESVKTPWP